MLDLAVFALSYRLLGAGLSAGSFPPEQIANAPGMSAGFLLSFGLHRNSGFGSDAPSGRQLLLSLGLPSFRVVVSGAGRSR